MPTMPLSIALLLWQLYLGGAMNGQGAPVGHGVFGQCDDCGRP